MLSAINKFYELEEVRTKRSWEQTRVLAQASMVSMGDKRAKERFMKQLKFPWDAPDGFTKEQIKEIKKKSDRLHGKSF